MVVLPAVNETPHSINLAPQLKLRAIAISDLDNSKRPFPVPAPYQVTCPLSTSLGNFLPLSSWVWSWIKVPKLIASVCIGFSVYARCQTASPAAITTENASVAEPWLNNRRVESVPCSIDHGCLPPF